MTEDQLSQLAEDRGLPAAELAKLRLRLETIDQPKRAKETVTGNTPSDNSKKKFSDPLNNNESMQTFTNDSSIFGSELFTKNSLVFEPNLRIPAPPNYILGPDDEIILVVYGSSEKTYNLTVNEEGNIYIPNVGPMFVSGLSLEQATQKIKNKLGATIYRAINSGQTKVQLSLGKMKSIRVTVIGEAQKPGTYTISSVTTLYNLLYLCGGPTSLGSYRAIEVIRGNEVKRMADLYAFLTEGNQKDNILLQEGDVIRIPYYKNRVSLAGEVRRRGKFELLPNETFQDLLKYSGGFNDIAYRAAVSVTRITEKEKKIIDLEASQYSSFKSNGSDSYLVGKLMDRFENRVIISGQVNRPSSYQFDPGMTVKALLTKAGGLAPDAYRQRVSIFRYRQNMVPTILAVNLDSVLLYNQDVALDKDDSIQVHSIFEFKDRSFVTLEGNVRQPGNVTWRENLTLRDVILSNGGLTDAGDTATIEVSRRLKNADVRSPDYLQSNIFNINLSDKNNSYNDLVLQPFDLIVIKSIPGYSIQRVVLVQGEVLAPGKYALQKSGDRLSDLFKRLGGFRSTADSNSVTIRRALQNNLSISQREKVFQRILNISQDSLDVNEKLRNDLYKDYDIISVNLGKTLSDPSSSENILLEQGDIISIDRSSNLVKISGEVYYPTQIPYKNNTTLKYYIQQAGNFTPSARKTGALVVYPDGRAKSVRHFLFFKSYPKVKPRSEIFVPQKLRNNRSRLGTAEWAVIVSSIGLVITAIKALFP
ncbi:MAG: SLBB domain-containing protein [Ferruginibacter sp.]